ncbi:MAG TPA: glycerate kinase [Tepidisphaeraceae bacterium]|jgi:glycerate kinase
MKIVLAPDKFKGSLSAPDVCAAMTRGLRAANPDIEIDACPVADGGEGTVAALVAATGGRFETRRVTGPLPEMKVDATFGVFGDGHTAVIEMAASSGLAMLKPEDRNPLNTTTFGTGELLMAAAALGASEIILGIGGSATVDGGIGCIQACGLPVLLEGGEPLSPTEPLCGRDLPSVLMVKHGRGSTVERVRIRVACDVSNPLFGPTGAARVFGPQKGATPKQVRWLDDALRGLAERTGKQAEARMPGAGAAGGLGFGMLAFFGATLQNGAQIVLDATRLQERLRGTDLCITGEGCLDAGSLHGKATIAVARLCKELGVPCMAIVGSVGEGVERAREEGLREYRVIGEGALPIEECIRRAPALIEVTAKGVLEGRP